jgi:hypothetical protein
MIVHDKGNEKNVSLDVRIHSFLNFQILSDVGPTLKFTFQNERGNVFGVELRTTQSIDLAKRDL